MKNHLSTLPSMGAGASSWWGGMALTWLASTRSGDCSEVVFALGRYQLYRSFPGLGKGASKG